MARYPMTPPPEGYTVAKLGTSWAPGLVVYVGGHPAGVQWFPADGGRILRFARRHRAVAYCLEQQAATGAAQLTPEEIRVLQRMGQPYTILGPNRGSATPASAF